MAEFSSHTAGTFSWAELSTSDQQAGVAFYRALLGWGLNDIPMGPAGTYSMFLLRGQEVAAAAGQRPNERAAGVPPHWNLYVTVANVDESVAKATALGAAVLAPPFDVMDAGRMAVVQDPTGAVLSLWSAGRSIGAKILGEPGALCWSELTTRDPKRAKAFYTALFGWTAKDSSADSPMPYTEFSNQGVPGIGMMEMPKEVPAQVPSYWLPYFQIDDCDKAAAAAQGLGATLVVGPSEIPGTGRFAMLTDPQGAMFALYARPR